MRCLVKIVLLLLFLQHCFCFLAPTARNIVFNTNVEFRASTKVGMTTRRNVNDNSSPFSPQFNNDNVIGASLVGSSILLLSPALAFAAADNIVVAAKFPLEIFINTLSVFMLARIVISWYPKTDLSTMPYSLAVWPTEPLLEPVRNLVPPAFGVDVSPIVWLALLSLFREIFTGQQGILTLMGSQAM